MNENPLRASLHVHGGKCLLCLYLEVWKETKSINTHGKFIVGFSFQQTVNSTCTSIFCTKSVLALGSIKLGYLARVAQVGSSMIKSDGPTLLCKIYRDCLTV